ncbi:leucine-rich repeat, cysteine-containing subtype protein, partial [Tanacetum coccineum]
ELVGFQFPPNLRSLSIEDLPCLLFKTSHNLEVLYTEDVCGDKGSQVIGQFSKKLRKLTYSGVVTHVGLIAVAKGCTNLESLKGLEYIGKYGANLRSLSLTHIGNSNAGFVKLSEGCPKLRKLKLSGCPSCEQVVTNSVFDIPSVRYVWFNSYDRTVLALIRPEFRGMLVLCYLLPNYCSFPIKWHLK